MATTTKKAPQRAAPAVPQRAAPQPPKQDTARAVAKAETAQLPAYLQDRVREDAGKGVSGAQEDNLVPLIYVLQGLSPTVQPGNPKQIPGAQQGDLWLRNAPEELQIVKPSEGVEFQPCHFNKDWVQWKPNRGGYVARHAERPKEAELMDEETDQGGTRQVWRMPNGDAVVETRYHGGLIRFPNMRPLPYVIPLSSTGHSVSKAWMFAMNGEQIDGDVLPAFAVIYRLSTQLRQKDNLSWYVLDWKKERYATEEEYNEGDALYNSFSSGEKRADIEDEGLVGGDTAGESATDTDGKI